MGENLGLNRRSSSPTRLAPAPNWPGRQPSLERTIMMKSSGDTMTAKRFDQKVSMAMRAIEHRKVRIRLRLSRPELPRDLPRQKLVYQGDMFILRNYGTEIPWETPSCRRPNRASK